ncbi:hypothetical protein [Ruegeria sp. MALMAid1280]|uniref:hypothetical protein n=1 Tax=Ruegeria sp. MALMAid1280 TaxID=3411634 RepID=UPI003BA2698A
MDPETLIEWRDRAFEEGRQLGLAQAAAKIRELRAQQKYEDVASAIEALKEVE